MRRSSTGSECWKVDLFGHRNIDLLSNFNEAEPLVNCAGLVASRRKPCEFAAPIKETPTQISRYSGGKTPSFMGFPGSNSGQFGYGTAAYHESARNDPSFISDACSNQPPMMDSIQT